MFSKKKRKHKLNFSPKEDSEMSEIYVRMNEVIANGIYEKAFQQCLAVWRSEKPEGDQDFDFERSHSRSLVERVLGCSGEVMTAVPGWLPDVEIYASYVIRVEEEIRDKFKYHSFVMWSQKAELLVSWWHIYHDLRIDVLAFFGFAKALGFSLSGLTPDQWRNVIEKLYEDHSTGLYAFTPETFEAINTLASIVFIREVEKTDSRVLAAVRATVADAKKLKNYAYRYRTREEAILVMCEYFGFELCEVCLSS